jgi:general secretion pathway protein E
MVDKPQFDALRRPGAPGTQQMQAPAEDKSVISDVEKVLTDAVDAGATDIHFEPLQESLNVRMRVKGSMVQVRDFNAAVRTNVLNRLKVQSGMDITKSRVPQTGFMRKEFGEHKIELYVYLMPTLYGEAVVVKLQYKQSATMRLSELGMGPSTLTSYRKALSRTSGLFLITGPPGSGKRTTVYASILDILRPDMLVMGFDPVVKYEVPGMIQSKPDDRNEYAYSEAIQALMRQEPDVAYIGDITNEAEARGTIQGAFARRLVFGRMTANDTLNAIQNLMDMGVQPFLLVASLAAVINQRLIRKLCPSCREAYPVSDDLQKEIGLRLPADGSFYRAVGCDACDRTGFIGSLALFELYLPSEELNKMIVAKEPLQAIRMRAQREGVTSLKVDGVIKALKGDCTLEEVLNCL